MTQDDLISSRRLRIQVQRADGVLLQDEIMDLGLETRLVEILDPAVGGNQRKVRSEQHLVLELGVGVMHQLRRKILGRPARQIDVHIGFVQAHG